MTLFDNPTPIPKRARVSIAERLIPSLSFGLAAASGVVGAIMMIRLFFQLRNDETAGIQLVLGAVGKIDFLVGTVLSIAAIVGLIGICVCVIRIFAETQKPSSPGFLYLIAVLPSLVSPLLVAYVSYSIVSALKAPTGQDFGQIGATSGELLVIAVLAGGVAILVLLAFSFIPFSSSVGTKYSPLIFIVLIEISITCLAYLFFSTTEIAGPSLHINL